MMPYDVMTQEKSRDFHDMLLLHDVIVVQLGVDVTR